MDIPLLTSEYLYKLIESINTLQNSVIYQKRCSRLARRSCQIAEKVKIDERNKLNPKLTASLELLKTCLEDIENHVKRFSKLEKRLAVRVTKYGTDHEEFVKLNERMQFCVIELHLDFDTTVLFRREDDDQDLYDDVSHLKLMLNEVIMNLEVSASISKNLVEHTLEMVNKQMEEMSRADSISTKRPLSADIAISLDDLTFQKVIGSGGFGTVWKGTYKGEPVAIKKLKKQTLTPEVLQEFRKEAIIMRRVSHPRMVACYGVVEAVDIYCIILEYMKNNSLQAFITDVESVQPEWKLKQEIALDVALGMDYLHRLRIVHRDLKSANILLDKTCRAKIADFGLSVMKSNSVTSLKMEEEGTVQYMAPECFGVNAIFSSRSDVYAFSIVLWEISNWDIAYKGVSRYEVKDSIAREKSRLPVSQALPKSIVSLLITCWKHNPAERPTFNEIANFLENLVFDEGFSNQNEFFPAKLNKNLPKVDFGAQQRKSAVEKQYQQPKSFQKPDLTAIQPQSLGPVRPPPPKPKLVTQLTLSSNTDFKSFSNNETISQTLSEKTPLQTRIARTPNHDGVPDVSLNSEEPSSKNEIRLANAPATRSPTKYSKAEIFPPKKKNKYSFKCPKIFPSDWKRQSKLYTLLAIFVFFAATGIAITLIVAFVIQRESQDPVINTPPVKSLVFVTTISGGVGVGYRDGINATFNGPRGIAVGTDNTVYVSDQFNNRVRAVNGSNGLVSTYAGTGNLPSRDGLITAAQFSQPVGIAVNSDTGSMIVSDFSANLIRRITAALPGTSPTVSTISGNVSSGVSGNSNGYPYYSSSNPKSLTRGVTGIAIASNSILWLADSRNCRIRRMNFNDFNLQTVAGNGTQGFANGPGTASTFGNGTQGLCVDRNDNVVVVDTSNHLIRFLNTTSNVVKTLAGRPGISGYNDGAPNVTLFNTPIGCVVDATGNIFIADSKNHRIRRIDSVTGHSSSLTGTGIPGLVDGIGIIAQFNEPHYLTLDMYGNLIVSDYKNHAIRNITYIL